MRLAVDEEGHDDGDDQAHDDGDDDAHVQRHVVGARGRWGGGKRANQRFSHTRQKRSQKRRQISVLSDHLSLASEDQSDTHDNRFCFMWSLQLV